MTLKKLKNCIRSRLTAGRVNYQYSQHLHTVIVLHT